MTEQPVNAREHPRYATDAAVELRTEDGQRIAGRTRNVSRGGLSALLPVALAQGTRLTATLALVFDSDTFSEPLEVSARVVWSTAIGDEFQIGVAFVGLDDQQRRFLSMFIRYLDQSAATADDSEPDDPFAG